MDGDALNKVVNSGGTPRLPSAPASSATMTPPPGPGSSQFESLNELLQKAGFKDTRIITPQAKAFKDMASSVRSMSSSSKAREEGSPSDASARSGTSGWFGWWGQRQRQDDNAAASTSTSATPTVTPSKTARLIRHARKQSSIHDSPRTPRGSRIFPVASPSKRRVVLAAPSVAASTSTSASANTLWKGSLAYRRSKADLREGEPTLKSKTSLGHLRGGGHAAAVGIGISTCDGGKALGSLRKSPAEHGRVRSKLDSASVEALESPTRPPSSTVDKWRRSLVVSIDDAEDDEEDADDVTSPPRFKPRPAVASCAPSTLFASAATPLVSSEAAVAPRNSECFQGPERRGLRHARSVEALRGALEAKRLARPTLKSRHSVIGQQTPDVPVSEEVPPVPALPSQYVRSPSDPSIYDSPVRTTYQADDVVVASGPPVLTLTSPTGVHSPQLINISGKEFDAQTFSPTGRMLVNEGGSTRGRRRSATNSSASSDSSPGLLDKPKRTRRGCRGGRKHKASAMESPTQRLLRKTSTGSLAGFSETQALRRTARGNSGAMMSFGAAIESEDDPFMAHVSAREQAKVRGMAAILADEDGENAAPSRVVSRASCGSLRGRMVGNRRNSSIDSPVKAMVDRRGAAANRG